MADVLQPVGALPEDIKTELELETKKELNGIVPGAVPILDKYSRESAKRFRKDGLNQFIPYSTSQYQTYFRDIWIDEDAMDPGANSLTDGSRCEILVVGAGYGGLLAAARLIQAGINVNDIRLIDAAGGYGGTWYYNRYPGLMCDVESYIYIPLLEELGYMPKHKYSYGPELRQHAENIADHFNLRDKTLFQVKAVDITWDSSNNDWVTRLESTRRGHEGNKISVSSRFVILAGGTLNWPKIPKLRGLGSFKGHSFHTSRWDWAYTGGCEEQPAMANLADKAVGIIGTGATAIQLVPELAKWAKHLYVFQRTPSAVDVRGQRETDADWWTREIHGRPGWQKQRRTNFSTFTANTIPRPKIDMVDDEWTKFPSYSGLVGGPNAPLSPDDAPSYLATLNELDLARQEKIRARVDDIVEDRATAEKLKAWYPGWCKRPCFHDEYLQSFNAPNVTLVHTDGRGVDGLTENSIVFDGREYPVDILVFSTGYEVPLGNSPGARLHLQVIGPGGQLLDDKWDKGIATLHGVQSNGFPNLFWLGLTQTGATPNQTAMVDELAQHIAFIITEVAKGVEKEDGNGPRPGNRFAFTIEPTVEAEDAWTAQIVAGAPAFIAMSKCPPSYFNAEGDLYKLAASGPEALEKLARGSMWAKGYEDWLRVIGDWRAGDIRKDLRVELL
ncbi:hypothetical protein AYO20_05341 [Fonsecaea nubica]|uniref:L-ornithine N(5)-oxygenase n=1 Tax=Fonsecaea nubica TaxID=856822 RepID=A0A178CZG9_9EURO|nr:hypothetical protein AYO20_05341 [Fonsecaea nubica]OAL35290.1 hypothetical protein AYO20_05341 [Fonsecaea nubica]